MTVIRLGIWSRLTPLSRSRSRSSSSSFFSTSRVPSLLQSSTRMISLRIGTARTRSIRSSRVSRSLVNRNDYRQQLLGRDLIKTQLAAGGLAQRVAQRLIPLARMRRVLLSHLVGKIHGGVHRPVDTKWHSRMLSGNRKRHEARQFNQRCASTEEASLNSGHSAAIPWSRNLLLEDG